MCVSNILNILISHEVSSQLLSLLNRNDNVYKQYKMLGYRRETALQSAL